MWGSGQVCPLDLGGRPCNGPAVVRFFFDTYPRFRSEGRKGQCPFDRWTTFGRSPDAAPPTPTTAPMAPRTSWKGFIKLSLVSVPVRAFTSNDTGEEIRLNQLHKECHSRIRYKKVCPEHGEVKAPEIVSGYEYAKDQYVVIDTQEVSKLRKEPDRSVRLDGFIKPGEIDPLYFAGKGYYLLPDGKPGEQAYSLLAKGMQQAEVYAVAKVVLSGREQLVLLRPVEGVLVLSVLSYPKKVKSLDEFVREVPDGELRKDEEKLTQTLIDASFLEEFDFQSYEDDYTEKLSELIQLKVDGKEVVQAPDHEEPKILNLMDALKKSVAEAQTSTKKMAPSVKAKKPAAKKKAATKKKSG